MSTIRFQAETYSQMSHALMETTHALSDCATRIPTIWEIGLPGLEARLNACRNRLHASSDQAKHLSTAIQRAAGLLAECEKKQKGTIANNLGPDEDSSDLDDIKYKLLSKMGLLGSTLSPFLVFTKKRDGKNLVALLGKGVKNAVKWVEVLKGPSTELVGELFGLTPYLKKVSSEALWKTALKKELDFDKLSDKAGVLADVASAAYDNYQEWYNGDISLDRAAFETVVESSTSILIDGAAGFAVGLAATTLASTVGVPLIGSAVVVGIVSVGVVWGADVVFQSLTNSDLSIAESVGHLSGSLYDGVKARLSDVTEHVSGVMDSACHVVASWSHGFFNILQGGVFE